uniref:RING-type domain-containing protein n=1 Tax=Macrostomum lignano TaxID=282301 RepID=A0A1I8GPY7_9PLAT
MALAINENTWWANLDNMVEDASRDPMNTVQQHYCCYPDCGVHLDSVGWICICCHSFCEAHAPELIHGGPNHRRRCHVCKTDLMPNEVNRFCVQDNQSAGLFSQVGRTVNQTFDMLSFSLDHSVKHEQERLAILAKLKEIDEADDRALAEAEAEKEEVEIELDSLSMQCHQRKKRCIQHKKTDMRNHNDSLKRQLNDREDENKRLNTQVIAANDRLEEYKNANFSAEQDNGSPSPTEYSGGSSQLSIEYAANNGAGPSGRHSNGGFSDATSSIGPSASAVGRPPSYSDSEESDYN